MAWKALVDIEDPLTDKVPLMASLLEACRCAKALSNVVFPLPEGPMIVITSPSQR